jgi:hypothetical protein
MTFLVSLTKEASLNLIKATIKRRTLLVFDQAKKYTAFVDPKLSNAKPVSGEQT